ncbi:hypothetical protein M3O96_07940 [Aquiflexum sp. TKW24L]|uniref:hypothetical protein n=1 Tax=Aquiflexum sp. TKW24L TaxID=2942212 RepID=UPI0020C054DF|nr:hypothetical protein [Aquiflexum sp. TKW24L]MCL6259012.1 hypothetical protein [Aquiflexum sp. TKW24L]
MKASFTLFFILTYFFVNGQEITGNIKNHEKSEMDLVLLLFGMDYPISIGSVDKKGLFTANLDNANLDNIPNENMSMSIGPLYFNFFFNCSNPTDFGGNAEKSAARQDFVRMTKDGEWKGTAFLVSDEGLRPWIEDSGYNNAIKGSFYEVMYVEEDLSIKTSCTSSVYVDDNTEIGTEYSFDIELKKGFNWVEYTILEVYKTDPSIRASFPSKVTISNMKDPSKMLWVGTYY